MPEGFELPDGDDLAIPPPFFPDDRPDYISDDRSPVRVVLEGVYKAEGFGEVQHFVRLEGRHHSLSIAIGGFEAQAILLPMQEVKSDRPMTHDLLRSILERLGGNLAMVTIDDLWNDVYYARLHIERGSDRIEIDARPSDALAIAARLDAPIYVKERVFEIAEAQGTE